MDVELERELQTERIKARKDWVRYVELKTSMYRQHLASIEAELAPIVDDLLRHDVGRAAARRPKQIRPVNGRFESRR